MNDIFFQLYRILVPKPIRSIILKKSLRKKILYHFASVPNKDINDEQKEILKYLEENSVNIFPYSFHHNYSPGNIDVNYDAAKGMRYVMQEGKRLYFKKRWGEKRIKRAYSDLLREQDYNSPHRYITDSFTIDENDVVADIGAAEGNFSLSVIEKVKKVYLFEFDREWVEALRATFEPWSGKVEIIGKYLSDSDDESNIRFDTFYNIKKDITFLKIDVDGAEEMVLKSCRETFQSGQPLKVALCTYHKHSDEAEFRRLLEERRFRVSPSYGYMIPYYDKKLKAPWLRRGLLRAVR